MDQQSEHFQVSLREGPIPGRLMLLAARLTFFIQSHLIRLLRNSLHPCNQPVETYTHGVQGQPAKLALRGGWGNGPHPACCADESAASLSPAASRICTTSVLPNKAASCKALPFSVWKANESAEQDVIRTVARVWRGHARQTGQRPEGTGK